MAKGPLLRVAERSVSAGEHREREVRLGAGRRDERVGGWLVRSRAIGLESGATEREVFVARTSLELDAGREVDPAWPDALGRVAEASVGLWHDEGDFGNYVDPQTGRLVVRGSASGGVAPAALAVAARVLGKPDCLEVACEAGRSYYENFTRRGLSSGGPGDAL
jgi:hypothetical protein